MFSTFYRPKVTGSTTKTDYTALFQDSGDGVPSGVLFLDTDDSDEALRRHKAAVTQTTVKVQLGGSARYSRDEVRALLRQMSDEINDGFRVSVGGYGQSVSGGLG